MKSKLTKASAMSVLAFMLTILLAIPVFANATVYTVDTLVKAQLPFEAYISPTDYFVQHGDMLYYADVDNNIFMVDLLTHEHESVLTAKDAKFTANGNMYTLSALRQIYYDNTKDTIVLLGDFKSGNPFLYPNTKHDVLLTAPDCELLKVDARGWLYSIASGKSGTVLGTDSNGGLIVNNADSLLLYSAPSFEQSTWLGSSANTGAPHTAVSIGGAVYSATTNALYCYDYKTLTRVTMLTEASASAVTENGLYVSGAAGIARLDLDGSFDDDAFISIDDIVIRDSLPLKLAYMGNSRSIGYKLAVSSTGDVVFYDIGAQAFRIISAEH